MAESTAMAESKAMAKSKAESKAKAKAERLAEAKSMAERINDLPVQSSLCWMSHPQYEHLCIARVALSQRIPKH